ncbi:msrA [Symbiodinium pilosum]|uniref:Peptide-methionine (S)-S-oxide reductase n=1 Tax=Symbiodinium pilosum TaxID=2952 RepID=A0A812LKV5_SYMPI|nr:msrA [Symbiodinium pilosum]
MTMLKDTVRMQAYRDAIQMNAKDFRDKVVLDIGCGTGVLAIFAAKAGARKVYAVEASDMASCAKEVVSANGLAEVVEVIRGMAESVELPEKVDMIISEWMGNFLFKESMLDTVLMARDRFLKPGKTALWGWKLEGKVVLTGGSLFPSHARLFLAPCAHSSFAERWQDYVDELWVSRHGVGAWHSFVEYMQVSFGLNYGSLAKQHEEQVGSSLSSQLSEATMSSYEGAAKEINLPITQDGLVDFVGSSTLHSADPHRILQKYRGVVELTLQATHWGQQLFGFFPESVDLFGPPAQLGLAALKGDELRGVSTKIFQVPMQDHTRKAYTRLCFAEEGSFKQKKESFTAQVELNHTSGLLGCYHEAWSDDSWYVRTLATELLHELGPLGADKSQAVLAKALHNLDQEVRKNAALALGKQGKVASKHANALCTRMLGNRPGVHSDDPDADLSERLDVRKACMWALGQLEPQAVMPHIHNLDDGLFHRNAGYRLVATQALANLGPQAVHTRKDHLLVMESTDRDDDALKGRSEKMSVSPKHFVLKTPMEGPWPANMKVCVLANGCFWGSEKGFWRLPGGGIHATAVGYAAGKTPNPTYEECCSGQTGHTEAVQVVYDPEKISLVDILRWFWESHDPTQGNRQGNDRGTQYRSALIYFDSDQEQLIRASKEAYEKALRTAKRGLSSNITTEIVAASSFEQPFFYAEDYHQQYLAKPGARPYCSAQPLQVSLPPFEEWAPSPELLKLHAPKLSEDFWKQHAPKPHCVIRSPHEPISWP